MGVTLERVQNKFACIIAELCSEPDVLSQFAVWVDLRIADYKSKGFIALDCSGDTPDPTWLKGLKLNKFLQSGGHLGSKPCKFCNGSPLPRQQKNPSANIGHSGIISPGVPQHPTSDTAGLEEQGPSANDIVEVVVKSEPQDVFPVALHVHEEGNLSHTARKRPGSPVNDDSYSDTNVFSASKSRRLASACDNIGSTQRGQDSNQSLLSVIGTSLELDSYTASDEADEPALPIVVKTEVFEESDSFVEPPNMPNEDHSAHPSTSGTSQSVPKYAFIQFGCDKKTVQLETKHLVWDDSLNVNSAVQAPWEGRLFEASVLGLSDDPTVLDEIERTYRETTLADPPNTSGKTKHLASLQRRSPNVIRNANLLRKKSKGINEFLSDTGSASLHSTVPPGSDVSNLPDGAVPEVSRTGSDLEPRTGPAGFEDIQPQPCQHNHSADPELMALIRLMAEQMQGMSTNTQRLEKKIDRLTKRRPEDHRPPCPAVDVNPAIPEAPGSPLVQSEETTPPICQYRTPTEEPFTDDRFWLLTPDQLGIQVTRDALVQQTSEIVRFEPKEDYIDLSQDEIAALMNRCHNATTLAKNIMAKAFTLGELYDRNCLGVNFNGAGHKKKALNQKKLNQLISLVRQKYNFNGLDKTVHNALNKFLTYLWTRKLNYPWLMCVR